MFLHNYGVLFPTIIFFYLFMMPYMKKNRIIFGIIVSVLLITGAYVATQNRKNTVTLQKDAQSDLRLAGEDKDRARKEALEDKVVMMKKDEAPSIKKEGVGKISGSYELYSPEKIPQKSLTGNVILFFKANWCPTCRGLDKDIQENISNIPSNVAILDVDYDNYSELKKRYGVTYQHTLVEVDKNGVLIKKWLGSPTLDALVKEIM